MENGVEPNGIGGCSVAPRSWMLVKYHEDFSRNMLTIIYILTNENLNYNTIVSKHRKCTCRDCIFLSHISSIADLTNDRAVKGRKYFCRKNRRIPDRNSSSERLPANSYGVRLIIVESWWFVIFKTGTTSIAVSIVSTGDSLVDKSAKC